MLLPNGETGMFYALLNIGSYLTNLQYVSWVYVNWVGCECLILKGFYMSGFYQCGTGIIWLCQHTDLHVHWQTC